MKKAEKDPAFEEIFRRENIEVNEDFLKLRPCEKADNLLYAIMQKCKYHKKEDGSVLFESSNYNDNIFSESNALLAIAFHHKIASGNVLSENIVKGIEKHVGANGRKLVPRFVSDNTGDAGSSLLMAVYYALDGKKDEAVELIENVENIVGFDENGLIKMRPDSDYALTMDNAWLSIAYQYLGRKNDANEVLKIIEEDVECFDFKKGCLYDHELHASDVKGPSFNSSTNASLAAAFFCAGMYDKGVKLLRGIGKKIGYKYFEREFRLVKYDTNSDCLNVGSSAALAIAFMAREYIENGN